MQDNISHTPPDKIIYEEAQTGKTASHLWGLQSADSTYGVSTSPADTVPAATDGCNFGILLR